MHKILSVSMGTKIIIIGYKLWRYTLKVPTGKALFTFVQWNKSVFLRRCGVWRLDLLCQNRNRWRKMCSVNVKLQCWITETFVWSIQVWNFRRICYLPPRNTDKRHRWHCLMSKTIFVLARLFFNTVLSQVSCWCCTLQKS